MPYSSGDLVTVDGIDYTVKAPADAYTVVDSDGNEMLDSLLPLLSVLELELYCKLTASLSRMNNFCERLTSTPTTSG